MTHHHLSSIFLSISSNFFFVLWAFCEPTSGLTQEAQALLYWKQSLPNQTILESWVSTSLHSSCSWRGITCDSSGSVIEISLSNTNLEGTLQNLNFSAFPNLNVLNLRFNKLSGNLPLSLADLTQLYELDLSNNNISGKLDPRLFPNETDKPKMGLIRVKNLILGNNILSGTIPNEIGNLRDLTILSLDVNNFYGHIPSSLGNCTHLSILTMSQNYLSGIIPPSIGRLTNLTDVRFHINNLDGPLPEGFGNLSYLTVLHLSHNNFTGKLPPQLCKGGKLVNFTAAYNSFSGPIPVSLRNCTSLYRVQFQENQLMGYADRDFGVYPNLVYIDFSYNRVQGELSANWGACKNLQSLIMAGNSIQGAVPSEIFQLKQLQKLDLYLNHISGHIPPQIGNSSNIYFLNLSGNNLSGMIPSDIGMLSNLQSLDLSMNKLWGPVPYQIGNCFRLLNLNLSCNNLSGTIPYQIGNLAALQDFLDLSYNLLSGEIPADLGELNNLMSLNLSHNNLSGSIPDSLGQMLSLTSMNLSYNHLEGSIPNGGIFNSSYSLDLSYNKNLCGQIQGFQRCNVSTAEVDGGSEKKKPVIAIVASLGGVFFVTLVLVGIFAILRRRNSRILNQNSEAKKENPFSIWHFDGRIVYEDIIEATENFDDKYCIGDGAFGKIYRVAMPGGEVFAVKKLKCEQDDLDIESIKAFKSEIEVLREIRHRNIVKLHGFCLQGSHTFFICEYMERGSLASMLINEKDALQLDWPKRINIIKGVAQALSYMHHDCNPPIIHRDISSNNVLLSRNLEAHVSDFGTARFLKHDSPIWTTFAGTYGYAAPELAYTMTVSEKCDVFSFGVLAFEVLMGKHSGDLIFDIQTSGYENINLKDILDPRLPPPTRKCVLKELTLIWNIALSCLQANPQSRPSMQSVAHMIEKETAHDS